MEGLTLVVSAASTWLLDLLVALLIGFSLLRPAASDAPRFRLWPWLGLLGADYLIYLLGRVSAMSGQSLAGALPAVGMVISQTHFGMMWGIGAAGWLAMLGLASSGPATMRRLWPLALLVFVYSHAATGHVADAGFVSLAALVHIGHLLATGAWAGSVFVFLLRHHRSSDAFSHGEARQLSVLAAWAMVLVLASGVLNAWRMLHGTQAPWSEPYGLLLIAKTVLVVVALTLGTINRLGVLPQLLSGKTKARPRFLSLLYPEAVVFVLLFGLAALLSATSPPG
ncbi:CopD family protein [Crenobacter sp. SG2303]|uniref:CopD family protein n=1 Tax=Crenobacter oryzisoli TaxID=3056844 RepID=A0ABT7XSU5_9NEIS|nr:CopD family protein [Crenobacter sp. SG2303]MDN0076876.1 CopD family protein [Crenobacter sp. SG2303]